MKKTMLLAGALCAVAGLVQASVVTGSAGFTTDADDQYYLPGSVAESNAINGSATSSGDNDAFTYVANDRSSKGMSFTTGSNAGGYTLNSIVVQNVLWPSFVNNGTFHEVLNGDTFDLRIGTISEAAGTGTLTSLLTTTATVSGDLIPFVNPSSGTGLYMTFALDGTEQATLGSLAANTTYFFEIASGAGDPFLELNSTSVDGYAGGQAFAGADISVLDADGSVAMSPGDFAFVADLAAIPEPATLSLIGVFGAGVLFVRRRLML